MLICITVMLLLTLCAMAWQDFAGRAIHWFLFPLLCALLLASSMLTKHFEISFVLINGGIAFSVLGLLHLYIHITKGHGLMSGERVFGWGDVLFFATLTLAFSPVNFVTFYVGSLIGTILLFLLIRLFGVPIRYIPLAGMQALLLALVTVCDLDKANANLYNDTPILNLISYAIFTI